MRTEYKSGFHYGLAALAATAVLQLREILGAPFGTHYPYHTVWLAVVFAAWYCGVGPSILAVTIDAVGVWYWFLLPYHSFAGKNLTEYCGMFGFLVFSGVIVALGESNRRLFLRRERAERALQEVNDQLENRVKERTADLERSNESARHLSARILSVQDEERRRLGRALHDSLGQYLAALKINLDRLELPSANEAAKVISECSDIIERAVVETRTISHLLHPPLLDERGLCSAIRLFVDGFSRRSGLSVCLNLPSSLDPRLAPNVEIALFRSIQEGLTNIHRYADATTANISLTKDDYSVRLDIRDDGGGMEPAVLEQVREGTVEAGVGIAGMRERLRELNGLLEIRSDKLGTALTITIPADVRCNEQVLLSSSS